MKISIITVCKNAGSYIEQAIQSVAMQTYPDIEYIVIDGDSKDNTKQIITQYKQKIDQFISEPDSGIYSAMNKGIHAASGDFIYFLNSDDYLVDENVIQDVVNVLTMTPSIDVVYGDLEIRIAPNQTRVVQAPQPEQIKEWMMFGSMPHQATFAKKDIFHNFGFFNEQRRYVADSEWYLNLLAKDVGWLYYPRTIASYAMDGWSTHNIRATRTEFWEVHNQAAIYQGDDWTYKRMLKYQETVLYFEEQFANQKILTQQVKADLDAKILEIGKLKRKLKQTQQQLDEAQTEIQAMQSSKFWKLRRTWIKLKQRIGLSLKN